MLNQSNNSAITLLYNSSLSGGAQFDIATFFHIIVHQATATI